MFLLSFITFSRSNHWIIWIFDRLELLLRRCPSFVIKNLYQPLFRIWIQPSGSTFGFSLRVQPSGSAFGFSLRAQPLGPRKHDARWERKRWISWSSVQMWIFWLFDTKQSSGEWCYLECSENQLIRQSKCVPKTRNSKNTLNHNFLRAKKRAFVITFISKGECLRVHSNRDSEKWHRKGHKNIGPLEECERGALQKNLKKWHRKGHKNIGPLEECERGALQKNLKKWHRKGQKNMRPLEECERSTLQTNLKKWHRKGHKNMCPLEECERSTL